MEFEIPKFDKTEERNTLHKAGTLNKKPQPSATVNIRKSIVQSPESWYHFIAFSNIQ